jgi:uncharacterized protein (DUF697 family)
VDRSTEALRIAREYTLYATGVGAIPVLGIDLAAVTAVQVKMIARLAKVYDVSFEAARARVLVIGILGSFTAFSHGVPGWLVARHHWLGPLGTVLKPIYSSLVTYAIANLFILHFERGGTLETFNPLAGEVQQAVKDAYAKGKDVLAKGKNAVLRRGPAEQPA